MHKQVFSVSVGINAPEELSARQIHAIRTNLQPGWHFPHKPGNFQDSFEDIETKIWSSVLYSNFGKI